jgi:hypothetical protein
VFLLVKETQSVHKNDKKDRIFKMGELLQMRTLTICFVSKD